MSQVEVQKVDKSSKDTLAVFGGLAKRLGAIERRAFDLFEKRGRELGHDVEDWLNAEQELGWPAPELSEKDRAYEIQIASPASRPRKSK